MASSFVTLSSASSLDHRHSESPCPSLLDVPPASSLSPSTPPRPPPRPRRLPFPGDPEPVSASEVDAEHYLSIDETDFGETDDDGDLRSHPLLLSRAHFQPFSSPDSLGDLWSPDLKVNIDDGHDDGQFEPGVVDWSNGGIEHKELPSNTTHLILARSTTPFQVAPLLTVTVPTLTHGLVVLDIGDCRLTEIPSAIASCPFLEELDLHGNPLATGTLPSFLGNLPSLQVLIADACSLHTLPSSLAQLTRLHTLTLRNNRLRSLPSWIARLSALEILLVDDNPFHWQFQNLVRPLLTAALEPDPHERAASSLARPPSPLPPAKNGLSAPPLPPGLAQSPIRSEFVPSPPLMSASASSTPVFHAFATPPPSAPPSFDLSDSPSPSLLLRSQPMSAAPSLNGSSSSSNGGGSKKPWGNLFKKVSTPRMRNGSAAKRPGALDADSRTFSDPVTRTEESEVEERFGGLFRSGRFRRKGSQKPPPPVAVKASKAGRRQSFLPLDAFTLPSSSESTAPSASPNDHQAALRSVLAYLRDLDDLSPDVSRPASSLDPTSPDPLLRHSPSLGALSLSPSLSASPHARRAQSTRRPPSRANRPPSSRLSEYYDESSPPLSSLSSSPTSTEGPRKIKDDPVRREAVLKEIVETEQTYVRGLEELCAIYVASAARPVNSSSRNGKEDSVLPLSERRAVFGNIEAIRDFHREIFLSDLLAAVRMGGESAIVAGRVAEVFVTHGSFLKIYSSYVNNFDVALAHIQNWVSSSSASPRPSTASGATAAAGASSTLFDAAAQLGSTLSSAQKKRIKGWKKRCRAHPSHSQISLESYLLLPVQRIPRYHLLLGSLLECTPAPSSPLLAAPPSSSAFLDPTAPAPPPLGAQLEPHPTIAAAVLEMDLVATTLNENKRETEGRAQLLAWQGRIVNKYRSSLVQPHRTLLRSGKLVLTRSVKRSTTPLEPTPPPVPVPPLLWSGSSGPNGSRSRINSTVDLVDSPQQGPAPARVEEIHTLFQESSAQELIALLCTDLLILVKAPPPPLDLDQTAPVELYTVVRLSSGGGGGGGAGGGGARGEGPASLFGKDEDMIRLKVGNRAILYLRCPSPSPPSSTAPETERNGEHERKKRRHEARQWREAINLQWQVNT
ncbi:hypothetical protein JCM1840_006312 [Sporobolomyces johnsonii]